MKQRLFKGLGFLLGMPFLQLGCNSGLCREFSLPHLGTCKDVANRPTKGSRGLRILV